MMIFLKSRDARILKQDRVHEGNHSFCVKKNEMQKKQKQHNVRVFFCLKSTIFCNLFVMDVSLVGFQICEQN